MSVLLLLGLVGFTLSSGSCASPTPPYREGILLTLGDCLLRPTGQSQTPSHHAPSATLQQQRPISLRPPAEIFYSLTKASRRHPTTHSIPTVTRTIALSRARHREGHTAEVADWPVDSQTVQPVASTAEPRHLVTRSMTVTVLTTETLAALNTLPSLSPSLRINQEQSLESHIPSETPLPILPHDPNAFESQAQAKSRHITTFKIVAAIIASLAILALVLFLILDPRVSRVCRRKRLKNKASGSRPISSWFPFPTLPPPVQAQIRKPVKYEHRTLGSLEKSGFSSMVSPRSKFSVTSSDFSHRSRGSNSTTDTLLVENTRANISIPPVRPPRPPTSEGPSTIPDYVYFATEHQIYMDDPILSEGSFRHGNSISTTTASESPLLPPSLFFTLDNPSLSMRHPLYETATVDAKLLAAQEGVRHSRNRSAPLFIENPVLEPEAQMYASDLVSRRVLQHRRSRSTSGWAYPRRKPKLDKQEQERESCYGVGEAL